MLVTPSGIVIDVSPEQPSNAWSPMLVTLSGIVIDVNPEQPKNAPLSMLVTEYPPSEFGIVIDPSVEVATAGCDSSPPPTDASPFDTV